MKEQIELSTLELIKAYETQLSTLTENAISVLKDILATLENIERNTR